MADNDHRWSRELPEQGASTASRARPDDPLAELARLIGRNLPMSREIQPAAATTSAVARDVDEPVRDGYAAPQDVDEVPDDRYSYSASRQAGDYPADLDSQYERRDAYQPARRGDEQWHSNAGEVEAQSSHEGGYADEYEQAPHDYVDDTDGEHAYSEEYEEDQTPRRRGGFIFVAAVFALAVLGTAGAFAYRAMFGGPMLPSLPPIIKAESGPTKIVPSGANAQGAASRQADASGASASERLVSREEQPLNVPPPVTTTPRVVSTVPVFPDPPSPVGPSSAPPVFPPPNPVPLVQAGSAGTQRPPAPRADPYGGPPGAGAAAANPLISADQTATSATPPPSASAAASSASGPKKVRTVTIRSDQSASDTVGSQAAARPTQQQAAKSSGDGPLSIVPGAGDTGSATTTRAARPATPGRPVPLNKPDTTETASVAPVASAGGYAVQVSSQQSEEDAQSSFRALQAKYPNLLGGRQPIVRRADLGAKGIYYRAMVGPFASADEATDLCTKLKAAGGSCLVQKN